MKTSAAGIDLIKRNEGCRLAAYRDVVGVWTIGYGDTSRVYPGMRITQQEAEDRLSRRLLTEFEPGVTRAIGDAPTTQPQFDAMTSLAWNIGIRAFSGSTVVRMHRAGSYLRAAEAFALWDRAGGGVLPALVRRRAEEAALYLGETKVLPGDRALYLTTPLMTGPDVVELQRLLGCGSDGEFGSRTRDALLGFQRRHTTLLADGVCGPATWAALRVGAITN